MRLLQRLRDPAAEARADRHRPRATHLPHAGARRRHAPIRDREAGETCFNPDSGCDATALGITLPIASYPRAAGQCITGGYVYRGLAIPALRGAYLYADYESAAFFALRVQGGAMLTPPADITTNINPGLSVDEITSFGQDNAGELYVVSFKGQVFRIDAR